MSFSNLFKKGEHNRNIAHFSALVNLANTSGNLSEDEEVLLNRLAIKLGIDEHTYTEILKDPTKHPVKSIHSAKERLERIHDLFDMVFADHQIDKKEHFLIRKYALGLGYTLEQAEEIVAHSIEIYTGKFTFDEYKYLIKKRLKN